MFVNPMGLLGLLGVAAVLGLHLYRRRRPPVIVSALFLWEAAPGASDGGRTREPLRRTLSLIAEVLCALFLALALAGPRLSGASEIQHYVAVIDGSASMHARTGDGETARTRARAHVGQMIAKLPDDGRVSLILTGPEPEVLSGPFALPAEALARLEADWPTFADHASTSALLLAAELAGTGTIDFVTDSEGAGGPEELSQTRRVAVGTSLENVGITAALRTQQPGENSELDEIRVVVQNNGSRPQRVVLEAAPQGQAEPLETTTLNIEPSESQVAAWLVPSRMPTLIVSLQTDDALDLDDRVALAPWPRRPLRVASTLDRRSARALGLREEGSASRWAEILSHATAVGLDEAPHLVIGPAQAAPPGAEEPSPSTSAAAPWRLQFQPPAPEPTDLIGPYLLDQDPLLRGVSFDGVIWSLDEAAPAPTSAETILGFAGEIPLVTVRVDPAGTRTWTLRLDPVRSTLGRSADWPIVLANAAEERRRALPGPEATNLAVGERFLWRGAPDGALTLTSPTGRTLRLEPSPAGDWITPRLDEVGVWRATSDSTPSIDTEIGVSLSSALESDLRGRASAPRPTDLPAISTASDDRGEAASRVSPVRTALALFALALLALDWWALARTSGGRP